MSLPTRFIDLLRCSPKDFRTAQSLASELMVSVWDIRETAELLIEAGLVRRPYSTARPEYRDWFALASKPPTWQERYLRWRAMPGREPQ